MRPPILHHQHHQQSSKRKRKWSPGPLGSAGSSPHSSISSLSSSESVANLPILNNNKFDAIEDDTIEWKTSIVDPVKQLKWSINSYFEADHRIARGEKFQVIAKRLNSKGEPQHLVAWDQPITKPFLSSPPN